MHLCSHKTPHFIRVEAVSCGCTRLRPNAFFLSQDTLNTSLSFLFFLFFSFFFKYSILLSRLQPHQVPCKLNFNACMSKGFIFKETVYAITSPSPKKIIEIKIISQLCFLIRYAEGHREQCIFDSHTQVQLIGQSLRWFDMQMRYIKG